ncbi:MAG: hypothetical protein B0W54_15730 [Cellvibrio sp. 79]|nr:MAG: hypothetical protein B0W54_15730 [Cellvibrio sp. 79]
MYRQNGLSLVELMIAITLGLILMGGVIQLFLSSRESFQVQQSTSGIQESGRLASEFINRDLRMAGFTGFRGRAPLIKNKLASSTYKTDYENGISVFESKDAKVAELGALNDTRVLVIRGVVDGVGSELIKKAELTKLTVGLVSTEAKACKDGGDKINGICKGDTLMISDYQKTIVFQASNITLKGTALEISYVGTWGGDLFTYDEYFMPGARVSVARTVTYFIKEGTSKRSSLFQKINDEQSVELLEGVSNMAVKFNRSKTSSSYEDATGKMDGLWVQKPTEHNPVISVKLELLVEGFSDNVLEEKQVYDFDGKTVTATDRRLRNVFSTTVALRNQLP